MGTGEPVTVSGGWQAHRQGINARNKRGTHVMICGLERECVPLSFVTRLYSTTSGKVTSTSVSPPAFVMSPAFTPAANLSG